MTPINQPTLLYEETGDFPFRVDAAAGESQGKHWWSVFATTTRNIGEEQITMTVPFKFIQQSGSILEVTIESMAKAAVKIILKTRQLIADGKFNTYVDNETEALTELQAKPPQIPYSLIEREQLITEAQAQRKLIDLQPLIKTMKARISEILSVETTSASASEVPELQAAQTG